MPFQVLTREAGRVIVIDAAGRMTLQEGRTQLRDVIHVHTGTGRRKFLVNLQRVEFIDSFGIGELARSFSVVRHMGGDMKLVCMNGKVLEMLEVTRLHTLFDIHADEAAALKSFS
jgi:anti-sigma B factor antagonist